MLSHEVGQASSLSGFVNELHKSQKRQAGSLSYWASRTLKASMENVSTRKPTGPLEGLKVIDLSHIMAGPACSMLLADMGADVIKVEKIPGGDDSRRMVPPTIAGESAAYLIMNRNKLGIALNLKSEPGREALSRLLKDADVLIENYRL